MFKKVMKKLNNEGNSFIMVIVSLSFLAVLTAALLVAIALCYRLKIMDINSRDNFYYLEQAMDEIYAGLGAESMDKLNDAYTDTIEVIVYYDTESKSYVTMDNEEANKLLKQTYMKLLRGDEGFTKKDQLLAKIQGYITNPSVSCTLDNVDSSVKTDNDNITIINLKLSRTAEYSTVTVGDKGKKDKYTQFISTDLVIGQPQFNVSFNTIDASMNDLFSFSMIADKGVEITNSKVNIAGDIYAASDFYNKDYNGTTNVDVANSIAAHIRAYDKDGNYDAEASSKLATMYSTPISSYGVDASGQNSTGDDRYKNQDGTVETSMYSGLYMSNSEVVVTANKIIVPGSIAAMNKTDLTVSAVSGNRIGKTEIWADSIVLGGYAMLNGTKQLKGSDVSLNANCFISDDLEVNSSNSKLTLIGEYYGYNNSTTDTRSFSKTFLNKNGLFEYNWDEAKNGGAGYQTGQAHYNSSSVIINGQDAALDLKDVSAMYIAGQSYIELSKKTTTTDITLDKDGNMVAKDSADASETVEVKSFTYTSNTDKDKAKNEGEFTADSERTYEAVQDYKTGEAVSIKSNQLAYIPPAAILEETDSSGKTRYYVELPENLLKEEPFKSTWKDPKAAVASALEQIPVVKTVISGKTYYYFDFTSADTSNKNVNEFIAAYATLFEDGSTSAAKEYLTDITDYENFSVEMLKLPTKTNSTQTDYTKIYSNAALTVKSGNTFSITANSDSIKALTTAADQINDNDKNKSADSSSVGNTINYNATSSGAVLSAQVTTNLQAQYKEMKLLLSNESSDATGVQVAHALEDSAITPINHYFDFTLFDGANSEVKDIELPNLKKSGYGLWTSDGDITITASEAKSYKGVIICKGDVRFDANVTGFEGIIVTGGKIIIDHNMDFIANEEVVKSVLRICEDNKNDPQYKQALFLFRNYGSDADVTNTTKKDNTESAVKISTVQFEDILEFKNWKKNVD